MSQTGPFLFLVLMLIVVGCGAAAFRQQTYDIPWLPGAETRIWQVEARIELDTNGESTQIYLTLPPKQSGFNIGTGLPANSPLWGFNIEPGEEQPRAHWAQRDPTGSHTLFYKINVSTSTRIEDATAPEGEPIAPLWNEPYQTATGNLLGTILPITADAHTVAVQAIRALNSASSDPNVNLLLNDFDAPELLAMLLRSAAIHARTVQVLELEDGRRRQSLVSYVQVWDGEQWRLYDPRRGAVNDQTSLLLWQTGSPGVLEVVGGSNSRVSFSMISQTQSSLALAKEHTDDLALSLYNLPIAEQSVFKLIMLLPVGALVVVLMRILIGIRTSGTFMPVLIALAFLQTELIPGLTSFIIVVIIGLFIRSYLSDLNLLLVARIGTLVVLVIGIISVFSVVSYQLGLIQGLTITFFPMIILAWTIERMSITWEEEGPKEVFIQGGGSLFVAVLAFLLMDLAVVEHLAFNFPELHLVLLGIMLLAGRYTGYRLLELRRFYEFSR